MFRKITLIGLVLFCFVLTSCTPIQENVVLTEEEAEILEYSHTWKAGDTYEKFRNPAIKGTVILFTYEINQDTKNKFSENTINNVYEVNAIIQQAQNKYENLGIKFLYVDSIQNPELLKQFEAKTPPVVVVLDNTGTQVHRFNPAAKSMINTTFTEDYSLSNSPSTDEELANSGMVDTVNRTLGAELDNVLKFLVTFEN